MDVLAFNGSPRKGGNTEVLLREVVSGIEAAGGHIDVFRLNSMAFRPCQNCGGCDREGKCVLQDDLIPVYDRILAVERIVIASPIYFYGVSAQTKTFIDRMQALWNRKRLLRQKGEWHDDPERKGMFLSVAATSGPKIFDGAVLEARYGLDAMGFGLAEELLVKGVDKKGEMAARGEVLAAARELGRRFVEGQ